MPPRSALFPAIVALLLAFGVGPVPGGLANPAAAELPGAPLTAEEFDRRVAGRTLDFLLGGAPYGTEQYLPGRRVIWAFTDGPCREGRWMPRGERICFEYDDEPGRLHCWSFHEGPDGLVARSTGMGGDGVVAMRPRDTPMDCPGPEVGV